MFYAQFFSTADWRGLPSAAVVEVEIIGDNTTKDETIVRYAAGLVTNVKTQELFPTREQAAERLIERVEEYRASNSAALDRAIEKLREEYLQSPSVVG